MVAPRSRPDPPVGPAEGRPIRVPDRGVDPILLLALRWAELGAHDDPGVVAHLATLLRRLATTLRAEPFWPLAARELGGELLGAGLHGPDGTVQGAEDIVVPTLRLLRERGPGLLCATGPEGERRLTAVLDELMAGYVAALHEHHRLDHSHRRPVEAWPAVGEHQIRAVFTQAAVGIAIAGLDGQVVDVNPVLADMLGIDLPLSEPWPVSDLIHPDDMLDVVERFQRLVRGQPEVMRMELRIVRPDSQVLWVLLIASLVVDEDGRPSHLMGVVEEISQPRRLRSRLVEATHQDQLVRLPNRAVTEQWLRRAFDADGPARVGICALDIDGFQQIHDGLGAQVGDRLLLAVAGRLQLAAGEHVVSRTGEDEFMVLMVEPENVADVCRLADRLQASLATPFHIDGHTLVIAASIGVSESATARACPEELLRAAEIARSWAKALGGGRRVVFDPEQDAAESARFALLSGLPGAVERGEFELAYQPLVRLSDGRLQGVEALVRWRHPEQGLIGPGRFIELAEYSGAIVPLGRWVLEESCRQAASWWRELGPSAPYVSVNVSPVQLAAAGWLREVTGVLEATGLPPELLQLEITEQAVLGEEAGILDALASLRQAGVRLALDDFGTGYSSLVWLRRLPVHGLKIDGSFIDGLRNPSPDPTDASIVGALVGMAHALNLEVTAEWVETAVQAERLAALGCDVGQGRWFGDAGPGEWVPGLWRRSIGP